MCKNSKAKLIKRSCSLVLCLAILVMATEMGHTQPSSRECPKNCSDRQQKQIPKKLTVYDSPPKYGTKSGWVYGKIIAELPKNTWICICEHKKIGFFFSKQQWTRIHWDCEKKWNPEKERDEWNCKKEGWVRYKDLAQSKSGVGKLQHFNSFFLANLYAQDTTGQDTSPSPKLGNPLYVGSFISILLGMFAKLLFDFYYKFKTKAQLNLKAFLPNMIPAFVVSPSVFLGFIGYLVDLGIQNDQSMLVLFFFAFQNGFFWHDILAIARYPLIQKD